MAVFVMSEKEGVNFGRKAKWCSVGSNRLFHMGDFTDLLEEFIPRVKF